MTIHFLRAQTPPGTKWTPWERLGDLPAGDLGSEDPGGPVFLNALYMVQVHDFGAYLELSIARRDDSAIHDWRDFQRIKNELVGPEAEAVELYPAESRLLDTRNNFHLWVKKDGPFEFGFRQGRLVGFVDGLPQRPFDPGYQAEVALMTRGPASINGQSSPQRVSEERKKRRARRKQERKQKGKK
jgi:hypothetical protein